LALYSALPWSVGSVSETWVTSDAGYGWMFGEEPRKRQWRMFLKRSRVPPAFCQWIESFGLSVTPIGSEVNPAAEGWRLVILVDGLAPHSAYPDVCGNRRPLYPTLLAS